ncbi:MAG: S-adenosylmethionine decarboxylase [Patescibacteria group bacterium]|nr:S-adenosylmethionine decarboxylase [Patescibacteria group bacterium]
MNGLIGFLAGIAACMLGFRLKRKTAVPSEEGGTAVPIRREIGTGCCMTCDGCLTGRPFGYSLLLDLYGCDQALCDDMNDNYEFLNKLVQFLRMHKQSEPTVVRTDHETYPDKRGLSSWVPLVESGIQIHTLTVKNFITIDIYSCREFDREKVGEYVKSWFRAKDWEEHFILRGTKYHDI